MNVDQGSIEDAVDDNQLGGGIALPIWRSGGGGKSAEEGGGRGDSNTVDSDGGRSGVGGSVSDEVKPKPKRGRRPNAAKLNDAEAVRAGARERLRGQLGFVVVLGFAKYGGWRAKKWEKINAHLAQRIEECYYIDDEGADSVANPAANFIARHLPQETVELVSDTLDPISAVAAAHSLLTAMGDKERRLVMSFQSQRIKRQRPKAQETEGWGHVDDTPIVEAPENVFVGA